MYKTCWKAIDEDGNILKTWVGPQKLSWIGTEIDGVVVSDIQEHDSRPIQQKRIDQFAVTLDRMNPVWYNSLTEDQKTRLASWRQEWLDYPSTDTEPTTDVSDIF